ncbi:cytochrome-c peroxidase [Pseudomonadota bacterium]
MSKTIGFAMLGVSSVISLAASAGIKAPSEEDINKYLRPAEIPQPANNLLTPERVYLGKVLFFDPRLSSSNFISCATCHNPALGWSDGQPTAVGHGMEILERSTPTILNTAYQSSQFWDGRSKTLEDQATGPIEAAGEMAQPITELLPELEKIPGYEALFEDAYPGEGISRDTIAKAIASFERTVVSTDSPFDRWLKGDSGEMSADAVKGFDIFKGKANCTKCHDGFNFTDNGFHNIGLDNPKDEGRFALKPIGVLKGAFKTPTLRDVALTAPYMHNGQFSTLGDVIDHYASGGKKNVGNVSRNIQKFKLSKKEKMQLVAFLKSLTGDPVEVAVPVLPVSN